MRVFVTGGAGFIGPKILEQLKMRNHEITCLIHERKPNIDGINYIKGSTLDLDCLKAMKDHDVLIANAGIYKISPPKDLRDIMYKVNVHGTINTMSVALRYHIPKIVFTSSIIALGNTERFENPDESIIYRHDGNHTSLYAKSKYDAHMHTLGLIKHNDAPITIAMPGSVYGENDHSFAGQIIEGMINGDSPGMFNTPAKYNWVYVGDVAKGIMLCLEKGKRESYILGGGQNAILTVREFTELAADLGSLEIPKMKLNVFMVRMFSAVQKISSTLTSSDAEVTNENVQALIHSCAPIGLKARRELNYNPKPIEERLKQTIDWYIKKAKLSNKSNIEDLMKNTNLDFLK